MAETRAANTSTKSSRPTPGMIPIARIDTKQRTEDRGQMTEDRRRETEDSLRVPMEWVALQAVCRERTLRRVAYGSIAQSF